MSDAHYIFKYHLEIGLKYFTCFLDGQAIAIKFSNQFNKEVMKKCLNSLNRVSDENLVFETIKDPQSFDIISFANKTPAKAFTPPAEKKIGTKWSFVEEVNE